MARETEDLDEDEGRTGDVGKQPGEGEAVYQRIAETRAVREKAAVIAQQCWNLRCLRIAELARFAEARGYDDQNGRAEGGEDEEDRLPVGDNQRIAADHRRDQWRERHH